MPSFYLSKAEATTLVEYFAGLTQHESALLGKELAELSEVHGLLIRLDLREVRIERHVESETLCHSILEINSAVAR